MTLYCLKLIVDGSDGAYASFTADQPAHTKLSRASFNKLHDQCWSLIKSNYQGLSEVAVMQAIEAALVLGDVGKSEEARKVFAPYGATAVDHDDFYEEVLHILRSQPHLSPTFSQLTSGAQQLLSRGSHLAHYGHITHMEGGPDMFCKLWESRILLLDPIAFYFDIFVHICDVAGALGHVNHRSSLVYTEHSSLAMQAVSNACQLFELPDKTEGDAYNAYLATRAQYLGLDPQKKLDRLLTRVGSMLRLFTPEEGQLLREAFGKLTAQEQSQVIEQLQPRSDDTLQRTPTYMPALLINLANNYQLGSSKKQRISQAVLLGLPFLAKVLQDHKKALQLSKADPKTPLNFNQVAGVAKKLPSALQGEYRIDDEGNVSVLSP